jgi:hypothetical protein
MTDENRQNNMEDDCDRDYDVDEVNRQMDRQAMFTGSFADHNPDFVELTTSYKTIIETDPNLKDLSLYNFDF